MGLTAILVFSAAALLGRALLAWRPAARRVLNAALLAAGVLAVYALQSSSPLRGADFWLPSLSIWLAVAAWLLARPSMPAAATQPAAPVPPAGRRERLRPYAPGVGALALVLLLGLTRYSAPLCCLGPSRPPALPALLPGLALAAAAAALAAWLAAGRPHLAASSGIVLLLAALLALKTPALALALSAGLRRLSGQSAALAAPGDLAWVGFSYLAFRLVHTLREAQQGKLPALRLDEFLIYALFPAAYTAGPIDRAPRFIGELRVLNGEALPSRAAPAPAAPGEDLLAGGRRILGGVVKKFVLADSLALLALNPENALQVQSTGWMWLLLLGYTLRIYLDFSGYTDIAIGIARLLGLHLPENFDRPYLKTNLTAFWNSWHITLAQWFRAYYFNPFTRWLRSRPHKPPVWLVVLLAQFSTMALIGLWHGVSWNFFAWGAWHGLGLFVHNRYSDWLRPRSAFLDERPALQRAAAATGWLLTFLFVALGWVWFALPQPAQALAVLRTLFGG
ncbi:MAG: MBOAT family O-acyltransferase [Chloroflexota bacterium]